MKREFNIINTLTDLNLPARLKTKLWESGVVSRLPIIDIISRIAPNYQKSEGETECFIDEIIKSVQAAAYYSSDYFCNRDNRIPDDVLYAVAGRNLIKFYSDQFRHLPESYRCLEREMDEIEDLPNIISHSAISLGAYYAHSITTKISLDDFLDNLRYEEVEIGSSMALDIYERIVQPAKESYHGDSSLNADILTSTRQIDFVINNGSNPLCWYIPYAAGFKRNIIDIDGIVPFLGLPDTKRIREALRTSYSVFADQFKIPCCDPLYEFAEQIINPVLLMPHNRSEPLSESQFLYALAEPVIDGEDRKLTARDFGRDVEDIEKSLRLPFPQNDVMQGHPKELFTTYKLCHAVSDFRLQTLYLWGDVTQPYISVKDMDDFLGLLKQTETISPSRPQFSSIWQDYRRDAMRRYNETVRQFPAHDFVAYTPS